MSPGVAGWKREFVAGCGPVEERAFEADPQPKRLLVRHAALVDRIVRGLWLAVGPRRGRWSRSVAMAARVVSIDIDVLILLPRALDAGTDNGDRALHRCLDAGLEVAHSVRTIEQCETEMAHDITIRTSLLEQRLLAGSRSLYERFKRRFESVPTCVRFSTPRLRAATMPPALSGPVQPEPNVKEIGWFARPANDHLTHVPRAWDIPGARWRRTAMTAAEARARSPGMNV
jgi:[protein-PII] uridylyltransferase